MIKILVVCVTLMISLSAHSYTVQVDPNPKPKPTLNYRCYPPLQFTGTIIRARLQGKSREVLLSELDRIKGNTPSRIINEMKHVINMVYDAQGDLTTDKDMEVLYHAVHDWCIKNIPSFEERKGLDDDGDGLPDYDSEGNYIPKYKI